MAPYRLCQVHSPRRCWQWIEFIQLPSACLRRSLNLYRTSDFWKWRQNTERLLSSHTERCFCFGIFCFSFYPAHFSDSAPTVFPLFSIFLLVFLSDEAFGLNLSFCIFLVLSHMFTSSRLEEVVWLECSHFSFTTTSTFNQDLGGFFFKVTHLCCLKRFENLWFQPYVMVETRLPINKFWI